MLKELYTKYNYTNNFIYLMEFLLNVLNLKNFMIQAAILGTGLATTWLIGLWVGIGVEFCLVISFLIVFIFIYLNYPAVGLSTYFNNKMVGYVAGCPHGFTQVALCSICVNLGKHLVTIGNCSHNWKKLNYDEKLVGSVTCDMAGDGAANNFHNVVDTLGQIAYHCANCHAVACFNCITG